LITLDTFFALGHIAAYGVLTLALCTLFKSVSARPAVAATLMAVGVGIEILQEAYFGRQFHHMDVAANMAGIAIALIFLAVVTRRNVRRGHGS
jgi:VanZ family protein